MFVLKKNENNGVLPNVLIKKNNCGLHSKKKRVCEKKKNDILLNGFLCPDLVKTKK